MPVIKDALAAYAASRKREFQHDRSKTVGASEIGLCARRTWFSKHGQEPDYDHVERWGATTRGDMIERHFWEKALRAHFGKGHLHYAGRYQKTFVDEEHSLSATPDGVVHNPDKGWCFVVECKSADPRKKLDEADPAHVLQAQTQLGLIRMHTRFEPGYAIISYIDSSFFDEVREFTVKWQPYVFAQMQHRAMVIMSANSADDLRPEGYIAGGGECEYCPFKSTCSAMRAGRVPMKEGRVDAGQMHEIATLAGAVRRYEMQAERLDKAARLEKDRIKDIMREAQTRRAEGQGVRVVWSSLKGRPSWDWPKLREAAAKAGLDLDQFETAGDPSDRLQIKFGDPLAPEAEASEVAA